MRFEKHVEVFEKLEGIERGMIISQGGDEAPVSMLPSTGTREVKALFTNTLPSTVVGKDIVSCNQWDESQMQT